MLGNAYPITVSRQGTQTANSTCRFVAHRDLVLTHVSAGCDVNTSFILDIGTTSDTDLYLDGVTVTGNATTMTEYDRDDFVGGVDIWIAKGTVVIISIDYDGGAGNDSANVDVTATFLEA